MRKWAHGAVASALLLTLLATQPCNAFPVDFVLIEPGDRQQPEPQTQEAREAPAEVQEAVDAQPAAENAKPEQPRRGIVRQKAAAVAEGAAEAAEEVGQIFGNLIGGLLGGRAAPQVQAKLDQNALKQFEVQYGRHFDQIVKTELHFIRVVCQPTRQQYDALAADGKLIRTKVLNKFATIQQDMNRGIQSSSDNDTRKPVSEDLLKSAKRHLTVDQVAKYESELASRDEARKTFSVQATTARLDRKLVLNAEQRAQIARVLNENWKESWGSMQMIMYGGDSFPNVPDSKILPLLTETQKKVWRTVNQQNRVFWGFNVGMDQGIIIADEQWDDDTASPEEATGKEPAEQPAKAKEASTEASE
tara:strand:+ start:36989 stop:38071 length:1083 start_codon:yes stop_codon:yes gene_type:complete